MTITTLGAGLWSEGWTAAFVNHLWQSTMVVAIAWLLALALRKNHARVRYWVWFAASVKFLLPFSLLMAAGEWMRSLMPAPVVTKPALANVVEQIAQPFPQMQFFDAAPGPVAAHHASWLPAVLLAVWACGALIVTIRFARGWRKVYAAKRAAVKTSNRRSFDSAAAATFAQDDSVVNSVDSGWSALGIVAKRVALQLDLPIDVPVLSVPGQIEPGIFGIFRPVLLLPEWIEERLTPEQMRAVVAHEMTHVRRRDNLGLTGVYDMTVQWTPLEPGASDDPFAPFFTRWRISLV